jgi:hypothetical protein
LPEVPASSAERAEALEMLDYLGLAGRITLGQTKDDDGGDVVEALRLLQVTPHLAQNGSRRRVRPISAPRATPTTWWADGSARRAAEILGAAQDLSAAQDARPRPAPGELGVHLRLGGLQPGPLPQMDAATG